MMFVLKISERFNFDLIAISDCTMRCILSSPRVDELACDTIAQYMTPSSAEEVARDAR